jgi:hypothetical protein
MPHSSTPCGRATLETVARPKGKRAAAVFYPPARRMPKLPGRLPGFFLATKSLAETKMTVKVTSVDYRMITR